jgi:16S rRNA C1402 (ribose-2'-O) methylase RsmI
MKGISVEHRRDPLQGLRAYFAALKMMVFRGASFFYIGWYPPEP